MKAATRRGPRRRLPRQARSIATADAIVEAAARVFRREGFAATTNRIAIEAGVGVGSIYEYFPDKQALLAALAERHVDLAEREIRHAIAHSGSTPELLRSLQQAIIASQRFPSQSLALLARPASSPAPAGRRPARHPRLPAGRAGARRNAAQLFARAETLRTLVLEELTARAAHLSDPHARARAVFAVLCELTAQSMYELPPDAHALHARHLLEMACAHLGERPV